VRDVSYAIRGWCRVIQNEATRDWFPFNRRVDGNFGLKVQSFIITTAQFNLARPCLLHTFNCTRNYQIRGIDEISGGGNWDYFRMNKRKPQQQGHESEFQEPHSLTITAQL
jgi:hypothetical protein